MSSRTLLIGRIVAGILASVVLLSPRPPGEDPEWWPEFEDDFREWSAGGGVDHHRAPVAAVEVVVDAGEGLKPPADVVVQM